MPAWTELGWKSSASVARSLPPSSPQPASEIETEIARRILRTASNPTGRNSPISGGRRVQDRGPAAYLAAFIDYSVIGLVHVLVLFVLIQTLAVVSGAHFNPAVTAAMTALRQIKVVDAGIYILAQLAGAVAGALLVKAILVDEGERVDYGATALTDRISEGTLAGMVVEGLGTFFLLWALTGAGFNPARSFGPALVSGEWGGADVFLLVYVVGPLVGALVAAFLYFQIFIAPGKKGVGGVEPVG